MERKSGTIRVMSVGSNMAESLEQKLTTRGRGNSSASDDDNVFLMTQSMNKQIMLSILFIERFG